MTLPTPASAGKPQKAARYARTAAGTLAILATLLMVAQGLAALATGADASRVMKLPAALAFFSLVAFVYAQKRILRTKHTPDA